MIKEGLSDELLLQGYRSGSADDFNIIYERYRRQLYSYLNRLLPEDQATADDLFQQTWVKALNQLEKYENREQFLAWLIRIAHNLAMDHFRAGSRRAECPVEAEDMPELPGPALDSPLLQMQNSELGTAIEDAVSKLSPELREVFMLRQEEMTFKDIAEIQKCSINTALARMQYALKSLRKSLSGWRTGKGRE